MRRAGTTQSLHALLTRVQIGEVVTTIPTIGFNVESVTYKNLNFNVWDLGGQTSIRPYWRCYYANTAAVIFVVDSTDIERLQTASEELAAMLNEEELKDAALLVFANKQDQPGAKGAGDISQALRLGELRDRNWSIMACSAVDGSGVHEGMDWLVVSMLPCLPRRAAVHDDGHTRGLLANWKPANGPTGGLKEASKRPHASHIRTAFVHYASPLCRSIIIIMPWVDSRSDSCDPASALVLAPGVWRFCCFRDRFTHASGEKKTVGVLPSVCFWLWEELHLVELDLTGGSWL